MKKLVNNQKGQNLIEVLFALAIFFVFIAGTVMLSFRYLKSSAKSIELTQVNIINQESWEAIQAIAYEDWDSLVNGTFGLSNSSGYWDFSGDSDTINDRYVREITIESVQRDESCNIVGSGGDNDPDTKMVTLDVNWPSEPAASQFSSERYFTNWQTPVFCLEEAGPTGQAAGLSLNISGANRDEYFSWINLLVTVDGIIISGISDETVVVDKIQVFMNEPSMDIYGFYMNDSKRWGWFGPGSPEGAQPSTTILDISNYSIDPEDSVEIMMKFFTGDSGEITFSINFIMEDGSEIETDEFTL